MKISEDIKPISYIKRNTISVLEQINKTGRPVIITQNGEPTAILQDIKSYEEMLEKQAISNLTQIGLNEINSGNLVKHTDVISRLKNNLKEKSNNS